MNLLQTLGQLRDDIKQWVTTNLVALDAKIESKTVPIDNKLDGSSTNPVQNKAISNELNAINTEVATLGRDIATIDSEIAAINSNIDDIKNSTNNSITDDESGEFNLADPSGNVIFKVDANGAHTTNLTLNGKDVGVAINTAAAYIDELETKVDNVETAVDNLEAGVEAQAAAIGELKNHNHDYNELENAPAITDDESGEVVYADEAGNIIARIDADGVKTTKVSANDVEINGKSVTTIMDERVAAMVDSAPEALNTLNELAGALGDDPNFATTVAQQIGEKANQSDLTSHTGNTTVHITSAERTAWNAKSNFSGSYNDLTNKPTIPTVNNATLTIQKNGTNVTTFTANSSTNATANITVPTKVSELTNDSGYLTSYTETDPTVPAWAKAATKPSYNASEVGAVPTSRTVNGKALSENISLSASDLGLTTETWTFTLEDGSTVTKAVYVGVVPMATITMNGYAPRARIEVNGTSYTYLEEPLEVPIGTVITCQVGHSTSTSDDRSSLIVNGNYVYEGRDNSYFYEYTVVGNVTISISGSDYSNCHMIITEQ